MEPDELADFGVRVRAGLQPAHGGKPAGIEMELRELVRLAGFGRRTPDRLKAMKRALADADVYPNRNIADLSLDLDTRVRLTYRPFERRGSRRDDIRGRARHGHITLVLGAGISLPHGLPNWTELAVRLWKAAYPDRESPFTPEYGTSLESLPQFLPIVFEMSAQRLEREERSLDEALRQALYADFERDPGHDTSLGVIARLLVHEFLRRERRIKRVVTFNIDDLVDMTARRYLRELVPHDGRSRRRRMRPVRAVFGPRSEVTYAQTHRMVTGPSIPIVHLHGWVPRTRPPQRLHLPDYEHRLVFTDRQYWVSGSGALAYANRVMGAALSDGTCIFIGTSMTDINLLRWLALHEADHHDEWMEVRSQNPDPERRPRPYISPRRHFWIRPDGDDPTGFLTAFLRDRGIVSVPIADWTSSSFEELMNGAFPRDQDLPDDSWIWDDPS